MTLPIIVRPGTIEVEVISGLVEETHFLLYVTLREKHATAECVCENPAIVSISATAKTLRAARDGESYEKINLKTERSTVIELPAGWAVEASCSGYTVQILGIKKTEHGGVILPFTMEDPL